MNSLRISKSALLQLKRCDKAFYFYAKQPWLKAKPDEARQYLLDRGTTLGKLARQLFPGGKDASEGNVSFEKARANTRTWIQNKEPVIYEASFEFEEAAVMTDIIVKTEDGWDLYEVKSSKNIFRSHLMDAGFQYYVASKNIPVHNVFLILPDSRYVRVGPLNVQQLFRKISVKEIINKHLSYFEKLHYYGKKILKLNYPPPVHVGLHCLRQGKCDFLPACFKKEHLEDPEFILNIPGLPAKDKMDYYLQGIFFRKDIEKNTSASSLSRERKGAPAVKKTSEKIITKESRWVCFDMEFFNGPVPLLDFHRPFDPVCVAADIYFPRTRQHRTFFLDVPDVEMLKNMIEHMITSLQEEEMIILFDKQQEKNYANMLKHFFPEKAGVWENLMEKVIDIREMITSGKYVFPELKTSCNLKSISEQLGFSGKTPFIKEGFQVLKLYEDYWNQSNEIEKIFLKERILHYVQSDTERINYVTEEIVRRAEDGI